MNTSKLIKYLGAGVVILLIIAVIGKKQGWFGGGIVHKVSVEKPEKRNIIETITANGKIQPETEVKISPDVSGEIVELNIMEGDEVKKGDFLLKIKPDIYQSAVKRMQATLNTTKANRDNAKARLLQVKAQFEKSELDYKRNKKLWEEDAISDAEFEAVESAYKIAKADVEAAIQSVNAADYSVKSAEAGLSEAQENLTKTTIYAPIDGTISMLNVELGERVVGTMQFSGTELLRIADLNRMEVKVEVNENDIVRVGLGDTSHIEIDAYLKRKFKGVVTEIANSANTTGITTDQVTSFDVKIRILPESYKDLLSNNENKYPLRPGMSATVDIETNAARQALTIPLQAVTTRPDTASKNNAEEEPEFDRMQELVFIVDDEVARIKKVKTGIQDSRYIQILEGIDTTDQVVIAPFSAVARKLEDSASIEIVDKKELFESDK